MHYRLQLAEPVAKWLLLVLSVFDVLFPLLLCIGEQGLEMNALLLHVVTVQLFLFHLLALDQ
jgi:hypothetical protein